MMERTKKDPLEFSIIIPVQKINDYIKETCGELKKQTNKNFEILIFPDELDREYKQQESKFGARIISTGKVSPAIKRDLSLKYAKGKYLAFTDDDAFPDKNWLKTAEKYLQRDEISAVGGPQLTPSKDSFWQKVSGAMFLSPLSGSAIIRYWPGDKIRELDDWPTVNFIIKKLDFEKIGGFDNAYWPGEDTKLCLDILQKLNKKILYVPELLVYHHRRAGLRKHLKQTGGYGLHRGFFAKTLPETSRKFTYFVPSILVLFLIFGAFFSFYSNFIFNFYILGLAIYAFAIFLSFLLIIPKVKSILISLATIPYLVFFHVWYGIRFIQGFVFTKKLNSKLGK